jgi:hypothetical protein
MAEVSLMMMMMMLRVMIIMLRGTILCIPSGNIDIVGLLVI